MALTIAKVTGADTVLGNQKLKVRDITFDSSYATGGESLTAANVGLRKIYAVFGSVGTVSDGSTGIVVKYDYTNSKLVALWGNAGTASVLPEVTSTTDLSTYSVRLVFVGY